MTDITFIDKDPEQILVDTIALYQTKAGAVLNDADPERILIDCQVYREVLLRNGMEWMMRQNFVQLAEASHLDFWGGLFGVTRVSDETDYTYRSRILSANKAEGLGTKAAYKARIIALSDVADVLIFTKNDDNTLLPGRVRLIVIKKVIDATTLIAAGEVHDSALEATILTVLSTNDFGIIGPVFEFTAAIPVAISGAVNVRATSGYNQDQLRENIDYQLNRYFGQLSLSFAGEFGISGVNTYLNNSEGLQQVVSLNFPNVPVLATGKFYQRGN